MSASPKLCASPAGRVRHNPYASPTTSTPQNSDLTPPNATGTPLIRSLSTSFASVPPMTPPVNYTATAWPTPPANEYSKSLQLPAAAPFSQQDAGVDAAYHPAPVAMVAAPFVPMPYEAMDAAMAFLMYNNASAAAAQAAQQQQQQQQQYQSMYQPQPQQQHYGYSGNEGYIMHQQQPQPQFMRQRRGTAAPNDDVTGPSATIPTYEELESYAGTLAEQARTAAGSSFIQAAVKDSPDPRCLPFVWAELAPVLGDLLLDAHGCYVVKTLLDRLPAAEIAYVLQAITADEQLGFSICTHSLHTRRVVQHIIETIDGGFLCQLMSRHCNEVAMTQQGCIVMQRSMDNAPAGPARDALLEAIAVNLVRFAKDPFANYVVQHLMEVGERVSTANAMWKSFQGHVVELACNKFASNVIEKCLFHCTAEVQHEILSEMYSIGHQGLYNMLQDSFGNYIIQSSIALATFRDVALIDERLRPVLAHTPYGHKIEARLDRRLKGKPVTARTPTGPAVPPAAAITASAPASQPQSRRGRGRGQHNLPEGEVAW